MLFADEAHRDDPARRNSDRRAEEALELESPR
jgi:hypothetical protein